MKKLSLLIFLLASFGITSIVHAQAGSYSFTASTGSYTPITGGTDVDTVEADTRLSGFLPIGFSFDFDGTSYTQFKASSNGFLSFGSSTSSQTTNNLDNVTAASRPLVAPLWDDLDGRAEDMLGNPISAASYVLTGTAPNRVLTFEWLNWEWRYNSTDPVISFQVKLYETSNVVEFIYKQETGAVNTGSASIGITGINTFLSLDGTGTAPIASNTAETANLSAKPATGQVYTFTPPSCPAPGGLSVSGITTTSANLDWSASTAIEYEVEYGAPAFTIGTGTNSVVTTNTTSITTLMADTPYEFYVRDICAVGDTSLWSGPFAFTTPCVATLAPYTESFDVTGTPTCWSQSAITGGPWLINTGPINGSCGGQTDHTGNGGNFAWMDQSSTDVEVILQMIDVDVSALTTPYLEFYYSECGNVTLQNFLYVEAYDGSVWNIVGTINQSTNGWQVFGFDLSTHTFGVNLTRIRFRAESGGDGLDYNADNVIDDVSIIEAPTCFMPTALNASNITSSSADLGWTANTGETEWAIEWGAQGFTQGSGTLVSTTNTNPYALTGLSNITAYDFYVRSICAVGDSSAWAGPFSFTTPCGVFTPTYTQDFSSFLPSCWEEAQGVLGLNGTTFSSTTASSWVADGFANNGTSGAARMEIYSTGRDEWLISPSIDLGSGSTQYQVEFDLALTTWNNTNADTLRGDDTLAFVISTDNGLTWAQTNALQVWDTTSAVISNTGEYVVIDLSAYTGIVKFGFYAASSVSGGDVNVYIDNFSVLPLQTCTKPLGIFSSNITPTAADINWTVGATNSFVEYGVTGFTQGTGTIVPGTSGLASITGLTPDTNYDFYVMDSCGVADVSVWSTVGTFFTGYCTPAPSSVDNDGITNVTLGTINNTTGTEVGNYGNYSAQVADVIQGAPAQAFSIEYSTSYSYGTKIWVDWDQNLVFDASEEVYFGLSTSANPTVLSGTFSIPATAALGNYRLRIGGTDNNSGPADACYTGSFGSFEDYTINVIAPCAGTATDVQVACDSLVWIDGITYFADNNTATSTVISNVAGVCDTTYTLDLTIINSSTGTDAQTACVTYTWIDGVTYTASNNTATFNIAGGAANGCDSLVTLDLTILDAAAGTDVQVACETFTWTAGDGMTYTASNNTATHTIVAGAANGCDSIVTLDLTINNATTGTDVQIACDTYAWIDGNTYTTNNNTATFTIVGGAATGCDSIVTLDLTINNAVTGVDVQNECDSYTWIDGNTYTASTNTATFNIVGGAATGCDSLVTLFLTINQSTTGTSTITACESYTWIDGVTYTASNNGATFILNNSNGCDSLVFLDLTINMPTTNTLAVTECESYTSAAGNTYTTTGIYTEVFTAANGCDSVLTLDVTIANPNNTVSLANNIFLTSNQPGATYQWIDCSNGNTPIAGATDQVYVAEANGDYACEVTLQNCTVTSTCITVSTVGIEDADATFANVFPNPVNNILTITLSDYDNAQFELLDMQGKVVMAPAIIVSGQTVDVSDLQSGIYFVRLTSDDNTMIKRVVKN